MNAYSADLDTYILLLKIRLGWLMKAPAPDGQSLDGIPSWIENVGFHPNVRMRCVSKKIKGLSPIHPRSPPE